ncbi:MAG: threonine synthase [Sarcina sp.]
MQFISTRNVNDIKSVTEAIIKGLSEDGGLYVPSEFPNFKNNLEEMKDLSYANLAIKIIGAFFNELGEENLKECINKAYFKKFDVKVNLEFLELYHGPTSAFKDAALLFLPQIMKKSKELLNTKEEIVILTATSGDTGKAALEGFKNIEGIKIIVFYPKDGVSKIQEYQMVTQEGSNTNVVAIKGNFDDAQNAVKSIFADETFKENLKEKGYIFSSANSINIARLVPQIVYYFYGYLNLVKTGEISVLEKINVCVPTGNFGNILAAYYAKQMGLPIKNFICASNENNVLTDFINTKTYDKNRKLILTKSPSMDILVSSNLERLLFEITGRNDKIVSSFMQSLKVNGSYTISDNMKENMKDFYGYCANEKDVFNEIKDVFMTRNYLMDTHTSVAYNAYKQYKKETKDTETKVLIASTASPFKFVKSIVSALELDNKELDEFELLSKLEEYSKVAIPNGLKNLDQKEILHDRVCEKNKIKESIESILESYYEN